MASLPEPSWADDDHDDIMQGAREALSPVSTKPYVAKREGIDFASGSVTWEQLTTGAPASALPARKDDAFDPELDCSRDGLPLLLKQTHVGSTLAPSSPDRNTKKRSRAVANQPESSPIFSPAVSSMWHPARSATLIRTMSGEEAPSTPVPVGGSSSSNAHYTSPTGRSPAPKRARMDDADITPVISSSAAQLAALAAESEDEEGEEGCETPVGEEEEFQQSMEGKDADQASAAAAAEGEKKKGPCPKVLTEKERLLQRQKQVDLGKRTPGYRRYLSMVPKDQRTREHPRTPNIRRKCSKRSWDGIVRRWRRALHEFDDPADPSPRSPATARSLQQQRSQTQSPSEQSTTTTAVTGGGGGGVATTMTEMTLQSAAAPMHV